MGTMRKIKSTKWMGALVMILAAYHLSTANSMAQRPFLRGNCTPELADNAEGGDLARKQTVRKLRTPNTNWNPEKVYKSPVVLVSFADRDFSTENPAATYDSIFNYNGYNKGKGKGCVADYFRDQSSGLFNTQFDIYGPIKLSRPMKDNSKTYGSSDFGQAVKKVADSLKVDFSQYDWNGDNQVEQVVIVYAGYGGNENASDAIGCTWPNTSTFNAITSNGIRLSNYTASPEQWSTGKLCGIGTICHEFSHSLGLPDIYPTNNNTYFSICDEWDLMDGGNFTNNGWCPPNYSAHAKMLLGWLTPIELTEPTRIEGMKAVSEGGEVYLVSNTKNEFFLLENRQWSGWDLRSPGHGLLISHVDYLASSWSANTVNNNATHHRYEQVHADNRDYNDWSEIIGNNNPYVSGHSQFLSNSPYPFVAENAENRRLTDSSIPAAVTFNNNAEGKNLLSKAIVHIEETEDGLISFDFMQGEDVPDGIKDVKRLACKVERYDLKGRKLAEGAAIRGIYIERTAEGTRKLIVDKPNKMINYNK